MFRRIFQLKTYNPFGKNVAKTIGEIDISVKDFALRVSGFQVLSPNITIKS